MTLKELFTAIAKAIKDKNGTTDKIKPIDFPSAITALQSGKNINLNGLTVASGEYIKGDITGKDYTNDTYKITLNANTINGGTNQYNWYDVIANKDIHLTTNAFAKIVPWSTLRIDYPSTYNMSETHLFNSNSMSHVYIYDDNNNNLLVPENIKKDVYVGSVKGTYTGETKYQQFADSGYTTNNLPTATENLKGLYAQVGTNTYQCQETELDGKPLNQCSGESISGQTLFIHDDDKYNGETSLGQEKYAYYFKDSSGVENTNYSLNITLEKVNADGTMKVREVYYKAIAGTTTTYYFYQYGTPSNDRDFQAGKGTISSFNVPSSYIGSDANVSLVLPYIKERVTWYAWKKAEPTTN